MYSCSAKVFLNFCNFFIAQHSKQILSFSIFNENATGERFYFLLIFHMDKCKEVLRTMAFHMLTLRHF